MTKSLIGYCLDATKMVLLDHLSFVPAASRGIHRDISRLSSLAETRGLPTFTLDLPALGKHFDKCLSEGCYVKPELPHSATLKASPAIPRLFSGLLEAVFLPSGLVRTDACVQTIQTLRQVYNLSKKLKIECARSRTASAVAEFMAIEAELAAPSLNWGGVSDFTQDQVDSQDLGNFYGVCGPMFSNYEPRVATIEHVCQNVFDILLGTMEAFKPLEWPYRHGPGAVSDMKVGRAYKYAFPTWSERLATVFPLEELAYANYLNWASAASLGALPLSEERPSRLIAVPKTQKGPRLIAAEPTANQFCQQAILAYLEKQIRHSVLSRSIKLRDQTQNQVMALEASKTGSHWTVDLSSASDRLSCRFIERAFRRNLPLLNAIRASRSFVCQQNVDKRYPSYVYLKKVATMGNACIFPVQSIAFTAMAYAAICFTRKLRVTQLNLRSIAQEVSVFGDDIIVPKDAGPLLVEVLSHFQLKVNTDKTHSSGFFRESCGVEAYAGIDVTPAYLQLPPNRRRPASILSAIDVSNNLHKKGLWKTADYVKTRVPSKEILTVAMDAECVGFRSFVGSPQYKLYWDESLQESYVRGLVLTSKVDRTKPDHEGMILQYFTEGTNLPEFSLWESGYTCRPRVTLRRGRVPLRALAG